MSDYQRVRHISFLRTYTIVHLGSRRTVRLPDPARSLGHVVRHRASNMTSSRNADRAMAYRNEAVSSFLERHGFSDVNQPRDFDESVGPKTIQMKPVFPIEVASDLGNEAMVNMLLDAGAITNPQPSSPTSRSSRTSSSSKGRSSFSFVSLCGSRQREEAEEVAATSPQLSLRSCLSNGSRTRLESNSGIGSGRKEPLSTRWI